MSNNMCSGFTPQIEVVDVQSMSKSFCEPIHDTIV